MYIRPLKSYKINDVAEAIAVAIKHNKRMPSIAEIIEYIPKPPQEIVKLQVIGEDCMTFSEYVYTRINDLGIDSDHIVMSSLRKDYGKERLMQEYEKGKALAVARSYVDKKPPEVPLPTGEIKSYVKRRYDGDSDYDELLSKKNGHFLYEYRKANSHFWKEYLDLTQFVVYLEGKDKEKMIEKIGAYDPAKKRMDVNFYLMANEVQEKDTYSRGAMS